MEDSQEPGDHESDVPVERRITRKAASRRNIRRKTTKGSEESESGSSSVDVTPAVTPTDPPAADPLRGESPVSSHDQPGRRGSTTSSESFHSDEGINDSITNFSHLTSSVSGLFSQATNTAWGWMKTSVTSVVSSGWNMWYGESSPEEWHCHSEDEGEEEEEEEVGEDADQPLDANIQPSPKKDKRFLICKELMTTEEAYVERLEILVMVKYRAMKVLQPDIVKAMFQNVEVIHQFHKDNLLPQIQDRINTWESNPRIGDIMRKLVPFLKLYTEYVKSFEKACQLVDTWQSKSTQFASLLNEISTSASYGRLRVQAHMLEPVQRVPRYELLLRDYLKRLAEDSEDRPDTEKAMQLVSEAASHFEDMMKRDSQILALMKLQNELDGPLNIVSANRELKKRGKILKISEKSGKTSDKYAFLFNDMMLVCNEQSLPGLSGQYKVRNIFELESATVRPGNNLDVPDTFYIKSTKHAIELAGRTSSESEEWIAAIQAQITASTKTKLTRQGTTKVSGGRQHVGLEAPVLVRMSDVSMCMLCGANFSTLRRKQHCKACGHVVCGRCSCHQLKLQYEPGRLHKVCDACFISTTEATNHAVNTAKGQAEGVCLERALLQLSSDGGKTWKSRYFSIHDSNFLYSFKAPQDIIPLTSLSLHGCKAAVTSVQQKAGPVLEIKVRGKLYYLHDDRTHVLNRWQQTLSQLESSERDSLSSFDSLSLDSRSLGSGSLDSQSIDSSGYNSLTADTPSLDTQCSLGSNADSEPSVNQAVTS